MTTFDEISSCPELNHQYWTNQARFKLALYRDNRAKLGSKVYPETYKAATKGYRAAFLVAMKHRRAQTYLALQNTGDTA